MVRGRNTELQTNLLDLIGKKPEWAIYIVKTLKENVEVNSFVVEKFRLLISNFHKK